MKILWKNRFLLLLPSIITGALLMGVGEIPDGLRLGVLSLPSVALLIWSAKRQSKIIACLSWLWLLMFWTDSLIRSASWMLFDTSIDAYFIVQSVANTTPSETWEFIRFHALELGTATTLLLLATTFYIILTIRSLRTFYQNGNRLFESKPAKAVCTVLILLTITAYALKPTRVHFTPIFWSHYLNNVQAFKKSVAQHQTWHQQWLQHARQHSVQETSDKRTDVLVISESLTSFNFGVCGYPRQTTPELNKRMAELTIFCNAYSAYPNTISALKSMLTDIPANQPDKVPSESVLADAKQAGYKIFWLSNQDDSYLSSLFGSFADKAIYNNKRSGRSSFAKDEELLPLYQQALADPAPKKLIILHFIGAHPNYSARYPEQYAYFPRSSNDKAEQAVAAQLEKVGAGVWVRGLRDEYDNSVRYQDYLIGEVLDKLKNQTHAGIRSFTFLPDHGNEVGHVSDYAGHSPNTEAGYKIPVVMWYDGIKPQGVNPKQIDAAELDKNLLIRLAPNTAKALNIVSWEQENYRFNPSDNWPYWKKDSK